MTATGTIENRYVEPLAASFEGRPTENDGSEFTFELHFSENVKTGDAKVRDRAFTLDEADIVEAKRENPQSADKNKAWTIRLKPDGNERITSTLPAAVSCTDNKSICTHDDRSLSQSTSATVDGRARLRWPRRRPAHPAGHGPGVRAHLPAAARRRLRRTCGRRGVRTRRHDVQPRPPGVRRGPARGMAHGSGLKHDTGFGLWMGRQDQVLQGSGFALNRATSTGGVLSFWSRSAQSSFYGQEGALSLNGDVRSTMFGPTTRRAGWLRASRCPTRAVWVATPAAPTPAG